jgi:deazaflavin-dependent oxidoreductase (nitroreductase family)
MGAQATMTDAFLKAVNHLHKAVLAVSGGRFGADLQGMPAVELHTTGRKSGKRRSTMLTSPVYEPDRVVLVASKGGDERNPEWYLNLVANPDVELTVKGTTRPMRARTAAGRERAELWSQIVEEYRGYAGYQERTDREIPVVILEPR